MAPKEFIALIVEEKGPGAFTRRIATRRIADLSGGDLLVRVQYSSLNYKDALSALGRPGVTRRYPHTPGIDAAGVVVECANASFAPGDRVIVTGHDLGMNSPGGFGQYIRVPSSWAVRLPEPLSLRESMIIGTAGLTAGLCLHRLIREELHPDAGKVLVTGATGGVGSIAVAICCRAGYQVVAATGKAESEPYLRLLGAKEVLRREEVAAGAERALMPERWSGVVDVVGGEMLAAAIKSTRYGGVVTCCGLAGSAELPLNVFPFILRGVTLAGIDSAESPTAVRSEVWRKLATEWRPDAVLQEAEEVDLAGLEEQFPALLAGKLRGRTVVRLPEGEGD